MSPHAAYAELGLDPGASAREVKSAWRRLVSQWHPDRNSSAAAVTRMQRVNQAFSTLRMAASADDAPQEEADTAREPSEAPGPASAGAQADTDAAPGTRTSRTVSRKLKLSLEEAALGCTRVLQGQLTDTCAACTGLGYHALGGECAACAGHGRLRQRNWYGLFGPEVECEACAGSGEARATCEACEGAGKLPPRKYRVTVRIPAGVRHGDMLQVDGSRLGPGQPAGGLQLRIEVAPHALFHLAPDGQVHVEVPVDAFVWLGQRAIEVPTLEGRTQSLSLSRTQLQYHLPGLGFPAERRGARGDLFVTVVPTFPPHLGSDQQILLDQLVAAAGAAEPAPRLRAWERSLRTWSRAQRKR